jgi:hypothetical protein
MSWKKNALLRTPLPAAWTAPWLRGPILMLCVLALASCARGTQATRPTIPAPLLALLTPIPAVSAQATMPCPALPLAADDRLPTLLRNHQAVAAQYHQCAESNAGLAKQARERERIEAERISRATAAMTGLGE